MGACRICDLPVDEWSGVCPNCGVRVPTPEAGAGPAIPGEGLAGAIGFVFCWAAFAALCWGRALAFMDSIFRWNEARGGGPNPPQVPTEPYFATGSVGLVTAILVYLLFRRRYRAFTAGLAYGLLPVRVVALGDLLVCGASNLFRGR